ncbi:MAG: KDO2-lipid IV(A) lauroyltransferase [Planctomycetota bacterium]|jgi:KDO2-lipid IV(A) lauroyltransferase
MGTTTDKATNHRIRHGLEYVSVVCVACVMRMLPRGWALELGAGIGRLGWWLRIRRGLVLRNLEQALPELDSQSRNALAALAARNFGRTVAEFLRFAGRDRERVSELVDIDGLDELGDVLAQGQGAVIVTAHQGAWALYVTALAAAGVPATLLVGVQHNRRVDELILGIPGDSIRFVSKGKSSPRELLTSLKEGRVLVMVADHYSSDQQVMVPFLGRPAYTLPLPGALVAKYDLPVFRMLGHRVSHGRHRMGLSRLPIEHASLPEETQAGAAAVTGENEIKLGVARAMNASLGQGILERPDQYFWYHDRWKQRSYRKGPKLDDSTPVSITSPSHPAPPPIES